MHFLCYGVKRPNLKLKTRPKQLLGSFTLDTVLPGAAVQLEVLHSRNWRHHEKRVEIFLHGVHGRRKTRRTETRRNHQQRLQSHDLGKD